MIYSLKIATASTRRGLRDVADGANESRRHELAKLSKQLCLNYGKYEKTSITGTGKNHKTSKQVRKKVSKQVSK